MELSEPVVNEETRSMRFAISIYLLMAVAGTLTSWLCKAQALALDGLVSGLNALMILVAERLSRQLSRPADRRYPFGYWSMETLYTGSRSLVLLGIIAFAVIVSIARILSHLQGAVVAVPLFGGIVTYSVAMVALCLLLAVIHHRHWLRGGCQSPLLVMERRAALVDGGLSAGVGLAFAVTPLLLQTPLAGFVPISDACIVLVLCAFLVVAPLRTLFESVRELGGGAASSRVREVVRSMAQQQLESRGIRLVDDALFHSGRAIQGVLYVDPGRAVSADEMDGWRHALERRCRGRFSNVTLELVLTRRAPLAG